MSVNHALVNHFKQRKAISPKGDSYGSLPFEADFRNQRRKDYTQQERSRKELQTAVEEVKGA
jgi:hypothetical protein